MERRLEGQRRKSSLGGFNDSNNTGASESLELPVDSEESDTRSIGAWASLAGLASSGWSTAGPAPH